MKINIAESDLAKFCRRRGIKRLSLFDSHQRGTASPDSDIDLLVEFETGRTPGFLALSEMEFELSAMLGDVPVDLRTPADLSHLFRDAVMASADVQYVA